MNKQTVVFFIIGLFLTGTSYYFLTQKSSPRDNSVLIVGTADDFPPFCFNQEGKIVGFDIDIAQEVAKRLNKSLQLRNMDFDILLLELQAGNVDVLAAGLTSTEEKKKRVFFTKPYLEGDPLVTLQIKKEGIKPLATITDLAGKKVVVNDGYTADLYITKQGIDALKVTTVAEAVLALTSEQAEVFVTAQIPLGSLFKQHSKDSFVITPLIGTEENCALAVTKKQPELYQAIEIVLKEMKEDGTIKKLKAKWEL